MRKQYTTPNNTNEWVSYILQEIPTSDIIHQSRVAGSNAFLRTLKEEGYTAEDLLVIHRAFALRYVREGMRIPMKMDGCHIDYNSLVESPDTELLEKLVLEG
tara:strand:+ start:5794 stop:6099 length:306 start_codon:yes stop_codon:yes gene_type:complete